jgi:hypothetical protein
MKQPMQNLSITDVTGVKTSKRADLVKPGTENCPKAMSIVNEWTLRNVSQNLQSSFHESSGNIVQYARIQLCLVMGWYIVIVDQKPPGFACFRALRTSLLGDLRVANQ